ncbi:MAG: riboflavin synthase, partial [bacterium]
MFTGIIEETGSVKSVKHGARSSVLTIRAHHLLEDLKVGDSINTNGVCLTVTNFTGYSFTADVMPETILRSAMKELKIGDPVNLERALQLNGRLGGHLVSGHVDGVGSIRLIRKDDNALWISIEASAGLLRYIVEKGSVA